MNAIRLVIPLLLMIVVSYNGLWIHRVYSRIDPSEFKNLGTLPDFEVPCSKSIYKFDQECSKLFVIGKELISDSGTAMRKIVGIGVGVILGGSNWYCETANGLLKIHQTGNAGNEKSVRDGVFLYQTASIPIAVCTGNLLIVVSSDALNATGSVGWKSGDLVKGSPSVVTSFKLLNDFFASYIRAFLVIIAILLLFVLNGIASPRVPGASWCRGAMLLFSANLASSSSLFDFLVPNRLSIGFSLLMAGGTGGVLFLIFGLTEIIQNKKGMKTKSLYISTFARISPIFILITLIVFYHALGGAFYTKIQMTLALTGLVLCIVAAAPTHLIFFILLTIDVLALRGSLPGLPSNTGLHFLFFVFIFDAFEWLSLNSKLMSRLAQPLSLSETGAILAIFCKRFAVSRASLSMFTRDDKFRTYSLQDGQRMLGDESDRVSHVVASVMTSRTALLRIQVGSSRSRALKGSAYAEDKKKGQEYCTFPLVHIEKSIGALNLTGYPSSSLGDPSQMILFLSLVERILPRLAESYYRRDLSPNLDKQKIILEIESHFAATSIKNKSTLIESLDTVARYLGCKIITSQAIHEEDRLFTFTRHNYPEDGDRFLENHSPRLKDTLTTSPANLAYTSKKSIYINDIGRMFSLYPAFLVTLLKQNQTKSLLVSPVLRGNGREEPWGVIWIEFPNAINQAEADLKDLTEFLSSSIHRQLLSLLETESRLKLTSELSSMLPEHVLRKIERGENPREIEEGYLLNIDLVGSTSLVKILGDQEFARVIDALGRSLSRELFSFYFVYQLTIWDAFIFTRRGDRAVLQYKEIDAILAAIDRGIAEANEAMLPGKQLRFRGVLHFGNTTRDLQAGQTKKWVITGEALAESCKLEATIKDQLGVLLVSDQCKALILSEDPTELNGQKNIFSLVS